jgi:hypothetical protein
MDLAIRYRSAAAAVLALFLPGCGSGQPFKDLVPVKGIVTFEGESLAQGTIAFAPTSSEGQPAIGKIVDGKFTMFTTADAPGVIAGTYKVRIESAEARDETEAPPSGPPGDAANKPASLIPEKYNRIETSELEIDVVPGMGELNWDLEP